MKHRLLFLVNEPRMFVSFRLPIAIAARNAGFEVHVASGPGAHIEKIENEGIKHHLIPLRRSGTNPLQELKLIISIFWLFLTLRPQLLHSITIKPVLYGGILARLTGIDAFVCAVSGLGTVFLSTGYKARILRWLVMSLYKISLGHRRITTIFQNPADRAFFVDQELLKLSQTRLLPGSGVDLQTYIAQPEPEDRMVISFAARLLRDKGIFEFVAAAEILKKRGYTALFQIIGDRDAGNRTSISQSDLDDFARNKNIKILGFREDIPELFAHSNIIVLPSYREGLPRVLCEAAACGRAVITTDVPGCRDAIVPGQTGLLVPVKNAKALADAMAILIDDTETRKRMGHNARRHAEKHFEISVIVDAHMKIYEALMEPEAA